jgi:hypothetical protein
MIWTRGKIIAAASSAVAAVGVGVGVSVALSGAPPVHRPTSPASPSPSPTPSRSVSTQLTSPLTGEPVRSLQRVLAVKIDNIVFARPQTGLTSADIVYVLPVEGGLSRFLAIFSSHIPRVIGPVRSARADDLELLRQFDRPAFAWSGAQPRLTRVVQRARIVDLYANLVGGYFRDYNRVAPYNLYADAHKLWAEARGASKAHNIGFRFGANVPRGGRVASSVSVSYPSASYRFTWSHKLRRWLIWIDGAKAGSTEGKQLSAATVVIQHTKVSTSKFLEYHLRPPYAWTIGHGTAIVLRNGKAYKVNWSRNRPQYGTRFTTPSGRPLTFAPGPVWIVLVGNRTNEMG